MVSFYHENTHTDTYTYAHTHAHTYAIHTHGSSKARSAQ